MRRIPTSLCITHGSSCRAHLEVIDVTTLRVSACFDECHFSGEGIEPALA